MKKLNKYSVTFSRHIYETIEIEAENKEDAENIGRLKSPEGFEFLFASETTDSIFDRVMEKNNVKK